MNRRWFSLSSLVLTLAVLFSILPACTPVYGADNYLAVIPRILQSGMTQNVPVTLLHGESFMSGIVEVSLTKGNKEVASASGQVNGKGTLELEIPSVASGDYEIKVRGPGFETSTSVKVESASLLFMETDKPIYKPGQTINISVITLDSNLKPFSQAVTVKAADAKGTKIIRNKITTDAFGMAELQLPLSSEPNLGAWKLSAEGADGARIQLDIRVEEYVLPKYELKVNLPKEWFLASDSITGEVEGIYSFGKPVVGELEIKASRYVGEWEEYARISKEIDGSTDFSLPPVGYVAGTPASGGMGNVNIEITVREQSTGYEETLTRLLTVAQTPVNIQIIPDSASFKPGLPLSILVLTQDPGGNPVSSKVNVTFSYLNEDLEEESKESETVNTSLTGMSIMEVSPTSGTVALVIDAESEGSYASKTLLASYSPSGNFIHVAQEANGELEIGDIAYFKIYATREAVNFYYEVVSRGRVVFSDYSRVPEIAFQVTPAMSPSAKLLVYQILPNAEVAADYIPFDIIVSYPQQVEASFNESEAGPGQEVELDLHTEGISSVIVTAVDKSIFILAENRLNLEQLFSELEKLYMDPQAELHEVTLYPSFSTEGAKDTFNNAGVVILTNNSVPEGKEYETNTKWGGIWGFFRGALGGAEAVDEAIPPMVPAPTQTTAGSNGLAEVQRIRQFFPETWLYQKVLTDESGRATLQVTVPDSITTWMLRALAVSQEKGLGIAETQIKAFQPFFVKLDVPYSAIRGEEFPVKVAVYNYLETEQTVVVQLEEDGWFNLIGEAIQTAVVPAGEVGSATFTISPKGLGFNSLKVSARSAEAADALVQPLLIEPEGVPREFVENLVLSEGSEFTIETAMPQDAVPDSGRVYFSLTGSYLTQTIEGLESLISMPFGCGEQNMLGFAPDVYIARYLDESGQLKPEIMAKLEKMMVTGYQRELTYRRSDGSFSAFGMQDDEGSLWLTAFVLKSFAQADGLIYIDQQVLDDASAWIKRHQQNDGSFEAVGFLHHQEMLGGMSGKDALTAYVTVALLEAGEQTAAYRAVSYLEGRLDSIEDAYTLAITSYSLELANSPAAGDACQKLLALAKDGENGIYWGDETEPPEPVQAEVGLLPRVPYQQNRSAVIETTAYAMLALIDHGDRLNAGRAGQWLVTQRNAFGGFDSTQDTVVGLQALTSYAGSQKADVDLFVNVKAGSFSKDIHISPDNFDVLQLVELPIDTKVTVSSHGKGEVIGQVVRRFNITSPDELQPAIDISVKYDSIEVEVNDLVKVQVNLSFNPPELVESGMLVVDISVPTGFAADNDSIEAVLAQQPLFKRYDISGRKVIFYIDNLKAGATLSFSFKVKAMYPVRAKGVTSQAYAYYQPEFRGESLSGALTVN